MNDPLKAGPIAYGVGRRRVLGLICATTAASLVGNLRAQSPPSTANSTPCVVRPEQTEGPYFLDERLNRSDIRPDPADGSVRPGAPLRLAFHISRIAGNSCTAVAGAFVDVWQCDALGVYSDVQDFSGMFDTRGKKFLRGYQTADAGGIARFVTIYPGWYPGRTVHIHFKIRTEPEAQRGFEFTSQIYFDDFLTDRVHAQAPYASKGRRTIRNDRDGIFRRGGSQLMVQVTEDAQGYMGTFDIGLMMT